jgi:Uma2 family endonuclease
MTAQSAQRVMWTPDPMRQRLADYTVEDILLLPDDAPRCELTDGVITTLPAHAISTRLGLIKSHRDTLEPDLVLLSRPIYGDHHYFDPSQAMLAVEIVSSGTRRRDRLEKPAVYAAAGVPHFWRIETDPVHVHAYDLVDGRYEEAGDSDEVLRLSKPFAIELRIREITP